MLIKQIINMELNLNNINPLKDLDRHQGVDEIEFWRIYLITLNMKKDMFTGRQLDIMSFALAQDYYKPPFRRGNSTKAAKMFNISRVQVTHLKDQLLEKGHLVYRDGDVYPADFLRPLQKFIKYKVEKSDFDIKLSLPFKIKAHGTNSR